MPNKSEVAPPESAVPAPRFALMFELEYLAVDGRGVIFQSLRDILKEKDIKFTPANFSRTCLHTTPAFFMEALQEAMGARKYSARKLVEDVSNSVAMSLSSKKLEISPALKKLLVAAAEKGLALAAISALPEEQAQALHATLGLGELKVKLLCFEASAKGFPRADIWLKAAKDCGVSARNCLALATSMQASKSALTAGMRCLVAPDSYTSFQDFGGALAVVESLGDLKPDEVLGLLPG